MNLNGCGFFLEEKMDIMGVVPALLSDVGS